MNTTTWPSRRASRIRWRVRMASAALACVIAGIYTAIGLGFVVVLSNTTTPAALQQATFGFPAALLYAAIAIMAMVADSRVSWFGGVIIQLLLLVIYADLAMVRTPAFEPVGVVLASLQVVLLILFGWLARRRAHATYRPRSPANRAPGVVSRLLVAHDGGNLAVQTAHLLTQYCATAGVTADSRDVNEIGDATAYDGIVLVSRLRHGSWSWKLQRFHHVHYHALVARHVWLVTVVANRSGDAPQTDPRTVRRLRKTVGVHSHTTVTSQPQQEALHQLAQSVARTLAGPLYTNATLPAALSRAANQAPRQ